MNKADQIFVYKTVNDIRDKICEINILLAKLNARVYLEGVK